MGLLDLCDIQIFIFHPPNNSMTTIRQFKLNDLLTFNNVNLDILTETYNLSFYLSYMTQWPESFMVAKSPHNAAVMGYVLGKAEGEGKLWHGHVSALTVAPEYRRLGLAATLMHAFEDDVCGPNGVYNAYFVDLFVRASNHLAIAMYEKKFGYTTYRRVLGYYSGEEPEDALDMRKALPRDRLKQAIIPLDHPVRPEDLEW
jgi:N-terminal acetyltransferase B complex catalytic subunit